MYLFFHTFRSCPECRTKSDFVTPSKYWIDKQEEKDALIKQYKGALRFVTVFLFRHLQNGNTVVPLFYNPLF